MVWSWNFNRSIDVDVTAPMTPLRSRILKALEPCGDDGLLADVLFDRVYHDDPDGGPLSGRQALAQMIKNMNKTAEGWRIESYGAIPQVGMCCYYRLVKKNGIKRAA